MRHISNFRIIKGRDFIEILDKVINTLSREYLNRVYQDKCYTTSTFIMFTFRVSRRGIPATKITHSPDFI